METIRILTVAMSPLMHYGLNQVFNGEAGIETIEGILEPGQLPDKLDQLEADVVLLNIESDTTDVLGLVTAIRRLSASSRILLLGDAEDQQSVLAAFAAGVSGYGLRQQVWPEDLRAAVRAVARGSRWICPTITTGLLARLAESDNGSARKNEHPCGLTDREIEILELVATGATNGEVADRLVLSTNTVKTYLRRVMDKLEVRSRHDAVEQAIHFGAVSRTRVRVGYRRVTPPPQPALPEDGASGKSGALARR